VDERGEQFEHVERRLILFIGQEEPASIRLQDFR